MTPRGGGLRARRWCQRALSPTGATTRERTPSAVRCLDVAESWEGKRVFPVADRSESDSSAREAHSRVRRQRCDGRSVRPPMFLRPRWTRRAAGTGHELLDLVGRNPNAARRQLDFLAAPAQPHLELLSFGRAAEGFLVQHPVSGALELIRRVDGPNAAGNSRKRRLPDREGDDGTGRRQLADHSFQGAGGAGRNRPPHPRDRAPPRRPRASPPCRAHTAASAGLDRSVPRAGVR